METKTLVFIVLLASGVSAGAFSVVLTCQPCSSSCSHFSCFKLTADGYNELTCVGCTGPVNEIIVINNCTNDYIGEACSSGLCIQSPIQGCFTQFSTASLCSTSQSITISCGPCISTPCSTDCTRMISSISGQTEICMDCSKLPAYNHLEVYACPNGKDPYGNACPCCATLNIPERLDQTCTAKIPLYNSTGFTAFAKTKTKTENTTTSTSSGALERYLYSFAFVALMSIAVILMF